MNDVIHGACLCGEIAFEVQEPHEYGASVVMGMCHCTRCQRWSGGPGVPFLTVSSEHLNVTRGQALIARYRAEGASVRSFCRRCGSSLFTDAGHTYYVSAGVLCDLQRTPAFHIQVAHKAPWDEIGGAAPQFAEMPTARPGATTGALR